jgi:ABC-type polysaccharide/polyol phosphate export permease
MFGVLYIVFSIFMRFGAVEHYRVYLLSGILLWSFFAETTDNGMESLLVKSSLISKLKFPRIIIPLSSTLTNSISIVLNMIVLSVFITISRVSVTYAAAFGLVVVLELIVLSFGVSLLLSSLYLKFRDLNHLWAVVLQLGFWATPIIYPIDIVPVKYHLFFKMNPMFRLIHSFRMAVIYGEIPNIKNLAANCAMVLIIFFLGFIVFNKRQKYFAEWI